MRIILLVLSLRKVRQYVINILCTPLFLTFIILLATYLVTGSNGGIGQQICNILRTDDKVNIICQTRPQNRNTSDFNNNCYTFIDFQHINSILNILERSDINKIGHIVHVAGLMSRNERLSIMHSVNCISPFGLTLLLIPSLLMSNPFPVITFVSSSSHIRSSEYQKGDFQRYFSHPTAGEVQIIFYSCVLDNLSFDMKPHG